MTKERAGDAQERILDVEFFDPIRLACRVHVLLFVSIMRTCIIDHNQHAI